MSIKPQQHGLTDRRLWRRLTGIVVIYALVLQSLLFGLVAAPASALASGGDGFAVFELCQHGPDGAPLAPADIPGHHGDAHCIFCFAGTPHYLGPGLQLSSLIGQADLKSASLWWPADHQRISVPSRYSIARPRGPPLSA